VQNTLHGSEAIRGLRGPMDPVVAYPVRDNSTFLPTHTLIAVAKLVGSVLGRF
jgi:hypothetical protein